MSTTPRFGQTNAHTSGRAPGAQSGQPSGQSQYKPFEDMSPDELVAVNDEWFGRVTSSRRHVERWALLATAFFMDQQYVDFYQFPNAGTMLTQLPAKKGRVRTVDNLIEPAIRNEIARLLRNRPHGVVIPDGLDSSDYEAARAGQHLITHITREHHLEEEYEEVALWALFGGTAVLDTQWDPTAGPPAQEGEGLTDTYQEPEDPLEGIDPSQSPEAQVGASSLNMGPQDLSMQGNGQGSQQQQGPQARGEFEFRTLSCFEVGVPHIRKRDIESQPYVMVTKAYELEEIYERWGVEVQADTQSRYGMLDERMTQVLQGGMQPTQVPSSSTVPKVPTAIVKETWIKPSVRAPRGLILITAGAEILEVKEWPKYLQGEYPFCKVDYTKIPGSFWSKGMVQSLIPLQRRHNRASSAMVEQVNLRSSVGVAVPRGTSVKSALGGKSTIYEMPPGSTAPAHNVSVPEIGDIILNELQLTKQSVADLSFQHEVSKGTTPPNVRSGTAINSLKEMDDSASTIPLRSIERAVEKQGNIILSMVRELWTDKRVVTVIGDEGDIEARSFIRGDEVGGNFFVQPGSAWPFSKAEKEAEVYRALEYRLIDPAEASRVLEMGGLRKVFNERQLDLRHARRENQMFQELTAINPETGEVDVEFFAAQVQRLRPADWHEHMVHLQMHNRLRKMPEYEKWPAYRQAAFEAHIMGHQAAIQAQLATQQPQPGQGQAQSMQEVMEQQAAQAAQAGQPGQPGEPQGGAREEAPAADAEGNGPGVSEQGEGAAGREKKDQPEGGQG